MKKLLLLIALFPILFGNAQEEILPTKTNKGKIFIYWGWNRDAYTKSDIHFTGNDYDFILKDVRAKDRQTKFDIDPYFNLTKITIPQTNFKVGYFFNDKYNISVGIDHMKYVMPQGQEVIINGNIDVQGSNYNKSYQDETIELTSQFLKFEHTDGLNYINVEVNRFDNLIRLFDGKFPIDINLMEGVGVGGLLPKTNTKLMNFSSNDEFHLAGFGCNVKVAIDVTIYNYFFIRLEGKAGYINMPDIRTTPDLSDRASQQFGFLEQTFLIGGLFRIGK